MFSRRSLSLVVPAFLTAFAGTAFVQAAQMGTAFTYQGQLKYGGVPVSETCNLTFALWNDPLDADPSSQIGSTLTFDGPDAVDVVNGLFTVDLDFGADAFTGYARWLEITVELVASGESGTLSPRQEMSPAPRALAL